MMGGRNQKEKGRALTRGVGWGSVSPPDNNLDMHTLNHEVKITLLAQRQRLRPTGPQSGPSPPSVK